MAIKTKEYIAALNDLASREIRMQLIYSIASGMLTGPWRDSLVEQFKEHQSQEDEHAQIAFRRIVALGGKIDPKVAALPVWSSLDEMLEGITKLEEEGVKAWQDLRGKLEGTDAFRYSIEDILAQEQHHWDEAQRWRNERKAVVREDLHIHVPNTASTVGGPEQQDQEALPPEEEDPEPGLDPSLDDQFADTQTPEEPLDPVQVYPVVGEERRLKVYGLTNNYFEDMPIGEAWQDENGELHGTGLCHAMLFEPFSIRMHMNAAAGLDTSPLAVFAYRISLSPFVRVEWEDPDAE